MSRVGKNPVTIPSGVECQLVGSSLTAKGKKGQLTLAVHPEIIVNIEDGKVVAKPKSNSKQAKMMWGTTQRLVSNLINGVHEGFTKELEIIGVGYRAQVKGNTLVLQLGFSHDVEFEIPEGIEIICEKQTQIKISGADRQKVGQVAAEIRKYRPPEPYKGKGVRYKDEYILRKEGKKK